MNVLGSPALWFVLTLAAAWWPSRFIGPLDGAPLDRPAEAILLGLALPWLLWLGREAARTRLLRSAVIILLVWKVTTFAAATQQGLCATVRAPGPLAGQAFSMRIDEPRGFLRSWDLRADLWADEPRCTAILARPVHGPLEFPAWFTNITAQMIPRQDLTMAVRGAVTDAAGAISAVEWTQPVSADGGWDVDPRLNSGAIWTSPLVTIEAPTAFDRALAPWAWLIAPAICALIVALLVSAALRPLAANMMAAAWVVIGSAVAFALALAPMLVVQRLIGVLALGALLVRVPVAQQTVSAVVWLIGAPWLTFFAAWSASTVGTLTAYSMDDWLAYQIAGYRIYLNGHWIEGGTATFDYQALYRWIAGALHLVFGDASVGEIYWDASWLLIGGLLAYRLTRSRADFRWGLVAAALTLATLTVATPWYIIGRGLPDITAAGLAFAAMACVMRGRMLGMRWVIAGALLGGLAFYARQNHLIWVVFFVFLLLPDDAGSDINGLRSAWRLPWKAAAAYVAGFAITVLAFMTRTWYFTGVFSLFHGTSLGHNDTGLRPWHLIDAAVWAKVSHSLAGLLFMNEPPHLDPRSIVVVAGATVGLLAAAQLAFAKAIPAGLLLVAIGGTVAAFLAHSHGYPGRFTIHVIPLASAMTAIAAASVVPTHRFTRT